MRISTFFAVGMVTIFACRSDSNNNTTDGGGDGGGSGSFVTIQQVQNDSMPPGTAVSLQGVVVTAIDTFGGTTGNFWVEEPEGGPFSGVLVYHGDLTTVASLSLGDIITLTGAEKDEFALTGSNGDTTGRTDTELEPVSGGMMVITKTGTGSVPTPATVDPVAIGKMYDPSMSASGGGAAFSAAWEMWEGVLITMTDVDAFGAPKAYGSSGAADAYDFSISGDAKVEGSLTDITMSNIKVDTCLGTVTGVVDYFYDYLVYPRSSADLSTGGTGCVFENAANGGTLCTDGLDNDGNGFSDCADLGCEVGSAAWLGTSCTTETTCGCSKNFATAGVNGVNAGFATTAGAVYLHSVYVTAVAANQYWIADSLTAAANGGALVFSTPPTGLTAGQQLTTVQGMAGPFPATGSGASEIEIEDATAGTASAGGTLLPLSTVATNVLSDLTNGKPYAGSLVKLSTVAKVTVAANSFGELTLTDQNGQTITMDDAAFPYYGGTSAAPTPPALGACLTVTGVMSLQTTDQLRTINPRSAADIVTATGCN